MLSAGGVLAAACALREDGGSGPGLVGYAVPRNGGRIDEDAIREHLRSLLPAYMVPPIVEPLDALPLLASGKLDRSALPAPRAREPGDGGSGPRPRSPAEARIVRVWRDLFRPRPVSVEDDFFRDLGGHSLLAARMVSELRRDPGFAAVSVADVYDCPTVRTLAARLEGRVPSPGTPAGDRPADTLPGEGRRHFAAGLLQVPGLYAVAALQGFQAAGPFLAYFLLVGNGSSRAAAAAWAAGIALAATPLAMAAAVSAKWILLGRVEAGAHPLWGWFYVRWWLSQTLVAAAHPALLARTPLLPLFYRLLGARIGRDVHMSTDRVGAFDLLSIGDGTTVDEEVSLFGSAVRDGRLHVGPIRIGSGCRIGTRSSLCEGSVVEDGARLEDLSLLPRGGRVPAGETWAGSPARPVAAPVGSLPPRPERGPIRRAAIAAAYALLVALLPLVLLAAYVPGLALLVTVDPLSDPLRYLAVAPVVGGSFILLFAVEVVLLKWLLVGRVRPGTYPEHGWFCLRYWVVEQLLGMSIDHAGQVRATLYLPPWFRALGARLGRFVELSTATAAPPDLLRIDEGGTVADEASVGSPRVEGGWMILEATRIGRRAFVGNSASIRSGAAMGEGSLVGVLSISPADPREAARPGAAWLGSPPIALPRREHGAPFPDARTYRPPRPLVLARGAFELLRITLPSAGFLLVAASTVVSSLLLWERAGPVAALLLLPAAYAAGCALVLAGVLAAKWILMGRYRPFTRPLWSPFVWRLELSNALYEFLAAPLALEPMRGTPFLPWYLRLMGVRAGRRVFANTTGFIEFDLVAVGDRAALNDDCVLQSHLFEDRVLKASRLRIGADCSVGGDSVVLYDAEMEDRSTLDALSLLMKGERLPAGTSWAGVPAARPDRPGEPDRAAPGGSRGASR
jgi:non-ribosomal peptide synthetase-like protein